MSDKNSKKEVKKRKCLTCGKMFTSEWNGNRMCFSCKQNIKSSNSLDMRYSVHVKHTHLACGVSELPDE